MKGFVSSFSLGRADADGWRELRLRFRTSEREPFDLPGFLRTLAVYFEAQSRRYGRSPAALVRFDPYRVGEDPEPSPAARAIERLRERTGPSGSSPPDEAIDEIAEEIEDDGFERARDAWEFDGRPLRRAYEPGDLRPEDDDAGPERGG